MRIIFYKVLNKWQGIADKKIKNLQRDGFEYFNKSLQCPKLSLCDCAMVMLYFVGSVVALIIDSSAGWFALGLNILCFIRVLIRMRVKIEEIHQRFIKERKDVEPRNYYCYKSRRYVNCFFITMVSLILSEGLGILSKFFSIVFLWFIALDDIECIIIDGYQARIKVGIAEEVE